MLIPKYILVHFLIWLIIPTILIWYIGPEFFELAVIGFFAVLFVDYIALKAFWLKYLPFALIGLIFAIAINHYLI